MSDTFYNFFVLAARHAFFISSSPRVFNSQATRRSGAYILACNHQSAFDVPLLIRHTRRRVDFLSITDLFRNKFVALFFRQMNAFPLNRHRPDPATIRIILDRLRKGRVVGIFPEGRMRPDETAVVHGGKIRTGIGKIAVLAQVPILPCVIFNSGEYWKIKNWMPGAQTKYALIYGEPIFANSILDENQAATDLEQRLCGEFVSLYQQLGRRLVDEKWFRNAEKNLVTDGDTDEHR